MIDLKRLQAVVYKLKNRVIRETEFSPKCPSCHDERFYLIAQDVIRDLGDILAALDSAVGPIMENPRGNQRPN